MSCSSMRYLNVMIIVHIQHTVCNGKYAQVAFAWKRVIVAELLFAFITNQQKPAQVISNVLF